MVDSVGGVPIAAVVILSVLAYFLLVLLIAVLYHQFRTEKEPKPHPQANNGCCASLAESCGCPVPSLRQVLNSCCPNKKISCEALVLCQCFRSDASTPSTRSGWCQCSNVACDCSQLNCVCCDMNMPAPGNRAAATLNIAP